jgi:serine/threonine protein kinase/Tfp pilus assembly protein PilF
MATPSSIVGQTLGHYRVLDKIGEGGMGAVYRAMDLTLHREVALKFLPAELASDPSAQQRLLKEARAASRLNHPNIATVYEVSEANGTPFIAMELVQGESLKEVLLQRALSQAQLLDVARQIAEGLAEAHHAGVLHRDIKPGNMMLDAKGRAKVLDFGLAMFAGKERAPGEAAETFITRTATHWSTGGTVPYMSPEQLLGEPTDARSDIFSFGVLLYECLTGRLPFRGTNSIDVLHAILHQPAAPLRNVIPDISPEWERLVERCLEKSPEKRFPSMQEVLEALPKAATPQTKPDKSVAVLYFENLSGAKEDEYFRDGMTEDVITELSKIIQLQVFPRSEVLAYRDKPVTAPQVGQQLSAAYVLEGTIRRAGNRLRITAQLVESRTRHSVWAERYDRELQDVFAIQDEIARSIAQALRVTLSPQEEKTIARKPTENLEAYDYYLRGRSYARRFDLDFSLQMFEQAIKLDSHFALAHAGIATIYGMIYQFREQDQSWIEKGLAACERALALEPGLAEVLAARAWILTGQKKYDEAIQCAQRAIELKSDCEGAYTLLTRAYFSSGRFQEVAALTDRALQASGDDYNIYIPLVLSLESLGQKELAKMLRERHLRVLEKQLDTVPEDVRARMLLASNYAAVARKEDALRQLQTAVALRPGDSNVLYNAACTYALLQNPAEALEMLKKAMKAGWTNVDWISRDPDLISLHDHPDFQRLCRQGPSND